MRRERSQVPGEHRQALVIQAVFMLGRTMPFFLLVREVLKTKVGNKLAATVRTLHNRLIVPARKGRFVTQELNGIHNRVNFNL